MVLLYALHKIIYFFLLEMKETVFVFFFYKTEFQFVMHSPKKKTIV